MTCEAFALRVVQPARFVDPQLTIVVPPVSQSHEKAQHKIDPRWQTGANLP